MNLESADRQTYGYIHVGTTTLQSYRCPQDDALPSSPLPSPPRYASMTFKAFMHAGGATAFFSKSVEPNFKDYEFYTRKSMGAGGMLVGTCNWECLRAARNLAARKIRFMQEL